MARTGKPLGRPRHVLRKTTVSITQDVDGWLRYMGTQEPLGVSGYLIRLAQEDRARALAENGADARKYRLFLMSMDMGDELSALEGGKQA